MRRYLKALLLALEPGDFAARPSLGFIGLEDTSDLGQLRFLR